MSKDIFDDFILVLESITVEKSEHFFDMMESLPEDQESLLRLGAIVLSKKEELELDEDELRLVLTYHLGLLHGGNNVKT